MYAFVLCALACAAALLAAAAPAGAHAALTGSDPRQGAVVQAAPTQVSLTFSEEVSIAAGGLRVLDPAGGSATAGTVVHTGGDTYRVPLRTGLPHGTYTVAYQVISADSHPVSGAYTFSVGAPSKTSVSLPDRAAGGGVVGALYDTARYVSYTGFILLVGGVAFVLACWPRGAGVRPVQRLVVSGWVAMTAATLALLLMRGSYTGSGKVADIVDLGLLHDVLGTKEGTALVSRLLLLAVAALFVAVLFGAYAKRAGAGDRPGAGEDGGAGGPGSGDGGGRDGTAAGSGRESGGAARQDPGAGDLAFGLSVGGAVVAIGLAATWALSEHASVGIQTRLAVPVDVLHLLAVATWLGGLATLLTALYRAPSDAAPPIGAAAVRRFSAVAFGSVLVLVATGLYQSWRQVGSWSALTGTDFGRLLLVKVALVAVVVAIAGTSRRWTGRLTDAAAATAGDSASAEPGAARADAAAPRPQAAARADATAAVDTGAATAPTDTSTAAGTRPAADTRTAAGASTAPEAGAAPAAGTAVHASPAEEAPATEEAPGAGRAPTSEEAPVAREAPTPRKAAAAEKPPAPGEAGTDAGGDAPARAAQLARQRAAMATARRRRLRDADPARSGLRRSVLAEAAVAVVVLAVTTLLTTTETGRTAEEAARAGGAVVTGEQAPPVSLDLPFDTGGPRGRGTVMLDLDPSHPGRNTMDIMVMDPQGRTVDVPEVQVALTLRSQHIGPLRITPEHIAPGQWTARGVQIPMAGDWQFALTVRTSDIDEVTVYKNAKIG
nr:copper resistance protein CopC [Streptomyces sulfonofaciens]